MGNHRVLNFPNIPVSGILHEIQMQGLTVFNKEKPSACKKYKKREKLILKWTPHDIWYVDVNKIYWIGKNGLLGKWHELGFCPARRSCYDVPLLGIRRVSSI